MKFAIKPHDVTHLILGVLLHVAKVETFLRHSVDQTKELLSVSVHCVYYAP